MEKFLKEYADDYGHDYNNIMYNYNSLLKGYKTILDSIISLKIQMERDLYKQDMYILANILAHKRDVNINFVNYDEFILCVNKILKEYNILNLSFKIIGNFHDHERLTVMAYYIGTFLEDEPSDIKIALKD